MGVGQIAGLMLFFAALAANLVAIATPGWFYVINTSPTYSAGLFTILFESTSLEVPRAASENVAFAFSIIADVFLIAAIVVVAIASCKDLVGIVEKLGGLLGLSASLFIMMGMAVYTGLKLTTTVDFVFITWGYSFALGWASFVLAFIGGIVALI